jgi:chromosome partitioning protein
VIDLDHQGAATNLLTGRRPPARGSLEVLMGDAGIAEVATPTAWKVDVVGASDSLARAELSLVHEVGRETVLRNALAAAPAGRWELCLIDTPPSLGLMTVNALVAADAVLSPVMPTYLSLLSLRQLQRTVEAVQTRLNPKLNMLGFLLCGIDGRDGFSAEAREALQSYAKALLWAQQVRFDAKLKGEPDAMSLKGRGHEDYTKVMKDLLKRLHQTDVRTNYKTDVTTLHLSP